MRYSGNILKMKTEHNDSVRYYLPIEDKLVLLNDAIGKTVKLDFSGKINCISCGREIKKTFHQGYCYPCFSTLPETDECILRPELCQAHLGISRDMEWSKKNCLQKHIVYLSLTSNVKVGVTRFSQVPTRWIDQGATEAIIIAETPNRHLAGLIEVSLKSHMADKTNWRNMLTNKKLSEINLLDEKKRVEELIPDDLKQYVKSDSEIINISFPVIKYPEKVKSINLDKTNSYSGVLTGIKGQYLIFDDNHVINIRKYNGYNITLEIEENIEEQKTLF